MLADAWDWITIAVVALGIVGAFVGGGIWIMKRHIGEGEEGYKGGR